MANYLGYCITPRIASDHFGKVLVPSGGLKSGDIVKLDTLEVIDGNLEVFTATQPATANLKDQNFAMVVPPSYETLEDGRRPNGQPDFTQYTYVENDIATVIYLDKNLMFLVSPDNVTGESSDLTDDIGKYIIPANATNSGAVSASNTTVGNSLKIIGTYDFGLGDNYANGFVTVYLCQAQGNSYTA